MTKAEEQRIVDQRQQLADVVRRAAERVQGHRKTWRRLDGPERGFQGGVLLDGVHGGRPPEPRRQPQLRVEDGSLLRQAPLALLLRASYILGALAQADLPDDRRGVRRQIGSEASDERVDVVDQVRLPRVHAEAGP